MRVIHRFAIILFLFIFVLSIAPPSTNAQDLVDDECAMLVLEALAQTQEFCKDLAPGEACFANGPVEIETIPTFDAVTFEKPGDTIPVDVLARIHTAPVNLDVAQWGIVAVALPANAVALPASPAAAEEEEDLGRLFMVGDVTLFDANLEDDVAIFDDFSVMTGESSEDCLGAPSNLIVQSPEESDMSFRMNGADITLGSTMVVDIIDGETMSIVVVEGTVTVTALGVTVEVPAGQMTTITISEEDGVIIVISEPSAPVDFDPAIIQFLPLQLTVEVVEIPALDRWTPTGVMLEAGQSYMVLGSELVKTIDYMPWSTPVGHSAADCAAAGRGDWDCRCRSSAEWGTCTIDERESMIMVGRVGDGPPFVVASGGFFTAQTDGELFLGPNDNTFEDNVGSYYAIITAVDLEISE